MTNWRLHELPLAARAGLSFTLLTLLGGLVASGFHLVGHHENRDEQPGLTLDDLEGAYHGVRTTAPLIGAIERDHPDGLDTGDRDALLTWLGGDRISEDYDNLELGERAPAEILDRSCLGCHARDANDGGDIGQRLPLEYWDDVRGLAFSRDVEPVDTRILVASAHTHALGMGTLSLLLGMLTWCTRWPRRLVGFLLLVSGLALFCDLGAWFVARDSAGFVVVIAVAGTAWMASSVAQVSLALLELWYPPPRAERR